MRGLSVICGVGLVALLAPVSPCQAPTQASASQIQKEFVIGRQVSQDLERRDGSLADPAFASYLQRISSRVAGAAGKKPLEIHITRSSQEYAHLLPGTLYISGTLLERTGNEAEPCRAVRTRTRARQRARHAPRRRQYSPDDYCLCACVPGRSVSQRSRSRRREPGDLSGCRRLEARRLRSVGHAGVPFETLLRASSVVESNFPRRFVESSSND